MPKASTICLSDPLDIVVPQEVFLLAFEKLGIMLVHIKSGAHSITAGLMGNMKIFRMPSMGLPGRAVKLVMMTIF